MGEQNVGRGQENANQAVGSKGEGEKREVRCEILAYQEKSGLPDKSREDWCEEVFEDGFGPSQSMERTSRWHRTNRKAEVEEAYGSRSRKGGVESFGS